MTAVRVLATSDATEPKDSSLQPVVAACATDVYSTLKLDVTVDSIKLELFTGDDSDLVSVTVDL